MMPKLLLVEDEAGLRLTLSRSARERGLRRRDRERRSKRFRAGGARRIRPRRARRDAAADERLRRLPRAAAVDLSARELKLLRHFIEHRGATLSRDELLTEVWGYDEMPLTRTVDVHVAGLRQKIEANPKVPEYILTIHGLGYKFTG